MSGDYTRQHTKTLAQLRAKGAEVSFSLASPGTQSATTGVYANPATTTVTGAAIQTKGERETYQRLGLIESEAPTLLFCPDTYGDTPPLMAAVSWGSQSWTVRDIDPVAIAGRCILARVVIAR